MNGDIRPPKRTEQVLPPPMKAGANPPADQPVATAQPSTSSSNTQSGSPISEPAESLDHEKLPHPLDIDEAKQAFTKHRRKQRLLRVVGGVIIVALLAAVLAGGWVYAQLRPVTPGGDQLISVTIPEGSTAITLGQLLEENELVRNAEVFSWYVRLTGIASELQAGEYRLSQGSSVSSIATELTKGTEGSFTLTFVPGRTLEQYRQVLAEAGYSDAAIDEAFAKRYDRRLFDSAPASADLEGFIYPETYQFASDASVESVLDFTFAEYERVIDENGLEEAYRAKGLSLFEGITLASIIEKEAANNEEMAKISQVFHLRLKKGMPLGSDPTYQYIADKTGVPRDTRLDSPYNTRIVTGLTPGPIASPSEAALLAAAKPADGTYLYFVHGDDGNIYLSYTNEEHEANVAKYCIDLCKRL